LEEQEGGDSIEKDEVDGGENEMKLVKIHFMKGGTNSPAVPNRPSFVFAAVLACLVIFLSGCEYSDWPFFTPKDPGVMWVANSGDDAVVCIDRINNRIMGTWNVGLNPSRTAVDMAGNCWVGCRNDTTVWFVTPSGTTKKFDGFDNARGVALDRNGDVWIANSHSATIQRITVKTGEVSEPLTLPGNYFYGALVDSHGFLWILAKDSQQMIRYEISRFPDPTACVAYAMPGSIYGFTIDTDNTVWVAGMDATSLYKIADGSATVETFSLSGQSGQIYSVVFDIEGNIWVTNDANNRLIRYTPSTGTTTTVQLDAVTSPLLTGLNPHGLGADEQGFVYSVNMNSNSVSKVDASECRVVATYQVGLNPYTYSDLTGFIYRNVTRKSAAK
jgi:DNA-binding beta-propeller fold protein YncE